MDNLNKDIIIVDLSSIPDDMSVESLFEIYNKTGVIFWDSYKSKYKPYSLSGKELKILDINDKYIQRCDPYDNKNISNED